MGTKVQLENYLAGHCSMRDLIRESSCASWPSFSGENNLPNGQFHYGFLPMTVADSHSEYDNDVVKQTMLEHEATFKDQVYELHRVYQVQRDLMGDVRRKEQFEWQIPYEASSSSSPVPSQMKYEDLQRRNDSSLPLANSICGRPTSDLPHSAKGKGIQGGLSSLQNCCSPKKSEVSELRPTKLRRRMLDLQLPADEYIDTDEVDQFCNAKVSDKSGKFLVESGKLFLKYGRKMECGEEDASRSDSHVGKSKVLADLNKPLLVDEMTAVSSAEYLSNGVCHDDIKYRDIYMRTLSSSRDVPQNSVHGSVNRVYNNSHVENRSSSQDLFCYALESEKQKGSLRSIDQGIHSERGPTPFRPAKVLLDRTVHPLGFSMGDHFKGDTWKENSSINIEKSDKGHAITNYGIPDPNMAARLPNEPCLFYVSDLGKSWDQSTSSWGKPSSSFDQKSSRVQTSVFLTSANLSRSPQSLARSNGLIGNKLNLNCSPRPNTTVEGEQYLRNGFQLHNHIPSVGFDLNKNDFKSTASVDVKPVRDVNLNVVPYDAMDDSLTALPWLRGKFGCSDKAETSNNGPSSYDGKDATKKADNRDLTNSRRILGVPIFECSRTAKKENSVENGSAKEETGTRGKRMVFDMNVPCELSDSDLDVVEVKVQEKKMQAKSTTSLKNRFDLNHFDTGIDLEAPIVLEDEEAVIPLEDSPRKEPDKLPEPPSCLNADDGKVEIAKSAAEAIIAISSSTNLIQSEEEVIHDSVPSAADDCLHLLANIACCSGQDDKEIDEFEFMTLSLKECTYEEYFPKPSIPEFPNLEESSTRVLTTRTRKGPGRRGRQRRDFQRDILPGLISLSRHEVTEDMQTFGGIMRAIGYDTWQFGLNRRNAARNGCGGGGRRRGVGVAATAPAPAHTISGPVQKIQIDSNSREVGLEERRLTGWGKTRRPRRQRLPAANLTPPLPLS